MKKIYVLFLIAVAGFGFAATNCNLRYDSNTSSSQADDSKKTETRTLDKFSGIDLDISAEIKLSQGSPQKVILEGAASDLEKITTVVEGSSLKIKTKSIFGHLGRITMYITMESIDKLNIGGSGAILAQTPLKTTTLELGVSGSGDIHLPELTSTTLETAISGSGSVTLAGKGPVADKYEIAISGSGKMVANDFAVKTAHISISGSGSCKLNVTEKLVAQVSGSGNIYYVGKPVVKAEVSGSGKVGPL